MSARLLFLLLFCSAAFFSQAQVVRFYENDTTYVFGDKINVRAEASINAATQAQLVAGDEVIIVAELETKTTLNGVELPWYQIRYQNNQKGFVWGGLLSVLGKSTLKDVRFVAGVTKAVKTKVEEGAEYTIEVRAIRNGTVLQKLSKNIKNQGSMHYRPLEIGARGLKGYSALLIVEMGFEACGYPWNEWYILWNGNQLFPLPLCESVADGGVFAHVERYEFPQGPDENTPGHIGKEDEVFYTIEHIETNELEDGSGYDEDSWKRSRRMRWDGKQWNKPLNMNIPKK
jgi:hypothetical protein